MIRPGREQLGGQDRRQPDRAGADDRDRVAGLHAAVQHADLERGRKDVGEEQHLLVGQLLRDLVDGRVGERHARVLGLEPVDQVAEDPAAAAGAEAVAGLLAEAAAPARGDARDEHAVAGLERRDRVADLEDRADGLVAEDRPGLDLGHVALEDVQVGPADRGRVDADDRVRRLLEAGIRDSSQERCAGTVVDQSFHGSSFRLTSTLVARERVRHRRPRRTGFRVSRSEISRAPDGLARLDAGRS